MVTGDNSENRDLKGSIFRARSEIAGLLMPESRFRRIRKYDRASTNRIGEVAGVSIGSLYPYFPSKEALVAAVFTAIPNKFPR